MTAREVEERVAEKILAFTPSFTLFINDNKVAMRRILGVLLRRNELPLDDAPAELKQNIGEILNPQVAYLGRIAQALELIVARGTQQVIDEVVNWVQRTGRTDMLDWIDEEALIREWQDVFGCSDSVVLGELEIKQKIKERLEQMQGAQQMAMDNDALDAAGKLAQIQAAMKKGGAR